MKTFTVKDLIEKLKSIDQTLVVKTDSYDVFNYWNGEIEVINHSDEGDWLNKPGIVIIGCTDGYDSYKD